MVSKALLYLIIVDINLTFVSLFSYVVVKMEFCYLRSIGCSVQEDILLGLHSLFINMKLFSKNNGKVCILESLSNENFFPWKFTSTFASEPNSSSASDHIHGNLVSLNFLLLTWFYVNFEYEVLFWIYFLEFHINYVQLAAMLHGHGHMSETTTRDLTKKYWHITSLTW